MGHKGTRRGEAAGQAGVTLVELLVAVAVMLVLTGVIVPLVNAPFMGILSTRPPLALRAKVMTAVLTFALLAGPIGLFLGGPLLQSLGPHKVFLLIAAGQLAATLPFAVLAFRRGSPLQAAPSQSST